MATLSKHLYLPLKSHIMAYQFHQLFMKFMIDFSVVFHLGFGHHVYQLLTHFWTENDSEMS